MTVQIKTDFLNWPDAPYEPFFAIITQILPRNVAGGAIALINSFGALGSFAGSYMVGYLNGTTGGFGASYIFMAGPLFPSAIITVIAVKNSNKILKDKREEEERPDKFLLDIVALD